MKLTDEQISNLWDGHVVPVFGKNGINPIVFARAIEAEVLRGITGDGRGEAKPVAWAWGRRDANGEVYDCISDAEHALNEGRYTVPLYTSPPQQEQAAPHPDEFTCPLCFDDPANIKAAPGAVQDGFVRVPVVATKEMCKAAVIFANGNAVYKNVAAGALEVEEQIYGEAYAAMIAAATKAQEPGA